MQWRETIVSCTRWGRKRLLGSRRDGSEGSSSMHLPAKRSQGGGNPRGEAHSV